MGERMDFIKMFSEHHGFSGLIAIGFFLVVFGAIPSPLMENQKILLTNQRLIITMSNMTNTTCVTEAMKDGNKLAARLCLLSNSNTQDEQVKILSQYINGGKGASPL